MFIIIYYNNIYLFILIPKKQKLIQEFKSMQTTIYKHISDHAGWNYLLTVLKKIILYSPKASKAEIQQLLNEHTEFVKKQLSDFPGHETIWYYLRLLYGFFCQYKDGIYDQGEKELQSFYDKEIAFINKTYLDENNPNTLLVEEKFALQYKLWLYFNVSKYK